MIEKFGKMPVCATTDQLPKSVPEGTEINLTLPDDFHHHFRDGHKIGYIVNHASQRFKRCIAMPNTQPPIINAELASQYYKKIMDQQTFKKSEKKVLSTTSSWEVEPMMTLYLTDNTSPQDIRDATKYPFIKAAKLYPANATTNSAHGVTNVPLIYPALREMAKVGLVLCIHSEVTDKHIDIFDREKSFIEKIMKPLVEALPNLKIVMEHISTEDAVNYIINESPPNVCATITAHHLLYNRNALLVGGIKPHFYCLPILKREKHRLALVKAATSGNPKFFAGTDSAPHYTTDKESACGCAGVYTAHAAVELYAETFESEGALDLLEGFLSFYGADFYGLERNKERITLIKQDWTVPKTYQFGEDENSTLTPLRAGEKVSWTIV